jgi:hypothetical protein
MVKHSPGRAVAEHVAEWAGMLELEVNPVIEDTAAAEGASRVVKK